MSELSSSSSLLSSAGAAGFLALVFEVSFFFLSFDGASVFSFFEDDGPAVGVAAASILRFFLEPESSLALGLPLVVVAALDVAVAADGAAGLG